MKCLLFLFKVTSTQLKQISNQIRPYLTENMGVLKLGGSYVLNVSINDDFPPTIVLEMVRIHTETPAFLADTSSIGFYMNNEQSISLFGKELDKLLEEKEQKIDFSEIDCEIEEDEIAEIIKKQTENNLDLDNILDKISSNGIQSLNTKEKKYLESYGK